MLETRYLLNDALCVALAVSTTIMVWAGLMVVTGSRYPIIVTVSAGGYYGFQRGTLLVLTNYQKEKVMVGEMVVFKVGGRDIPIVHSRHQQVA